MNNREIAAEKIRLGETALGLELGSTRIKAVLTDQSGEVLAGGFFDWENKLVDGIWTYDIEEIHRGVRACYGSLRETAEKEYGVTIRRVGAIGISAMMHGYMAFDKNMHLLVPFRTWRNSNTGEAARQLTELFGFHIPLRWSIAHLYQCMLNGDAHLAEVDYVATLDAYIHRLLTGERVTGIGDASGMFPIDSAALDYDEKMLEAFDAIAAEKGYGWRLRDIFPRVLRAGEAAGALTEAGAAFLDESGNLEPGIPFCPPEGDAGTGMAATNAVAPRTGNVSAGTSTFAMIVLERPLSKLHREIDMVTTPAGAPVAMSHASNGTSDLNAWVNLFGEFAGLLGKECSSGELFERLYRASLEGDADCGGLMSYGYYSGEAITHLAEGRPLFVRTPESAFTLANFMRAHLYSAFGAVKLGTDILLKEENVRVDSITGHGGIFKTKGVAQRYLAAAMNAPVTVMETAGEGGPWGMALLALYRLCRAKGDARPLEAFLAEEIFSAAGGLTIEPDAGEAAGFEAFMERYRKLLPAEAAAVEAK